MASFIIDGVHLPPSYVKTALRAKGIDRSILVTDATAPAGARPGIYRVGEQEIELTADNRVLLAGQDKLAGSALTMDKGLENVIKFAGLLLDAAVKIATINPAKAGRISGRENGLVPSGNAEFVLFAFASDETTIHIRETWVNGVRVFQSSQM